MKNSYAVDTVQCMLIDLHVNNSTMKNIHKSLALHFKSLKLANLVLFDYKTDYNEHLLEIRQLKTGVVEVHSIKIKVAQKVLHTTYSTTLLMCFDALVR